MKHGSLSPVGLAVLALIALMAALALPPAPAEAATINFETTLDEAQATTCNKGSTATGSGTLTLDTATGALSFNITFSGLSTAEIAAHIHGPAAPGAPAGIVRGLPAGSPKVGSVAPVLTAAEQQDLISGLYYVNIHSMNCGGGEIRGQITGPVGGIAELPDVAGTPLGEPGSSDGNLGVLLAIAAGVGAVALGAGAWFAVRRYLS